MSTNVEPCQVTDTANNQMVPFHKRFPRDIETIIFEEVCYHERIVPIHISGSNVAIEGFGGSLEVRTFLCFRSNNPVPAIMHVNVNARSIALRHYKLGFGVEDGVCEQVKSLKLDKGRIYVNPTSDIICAQPGVLWTLLMAKLKDLKVEKIALGKPSWEEPFGLYFGLAVCPVDGSHGCGWIDENTSTTALWTHNQPTELYYRKDKPSRSRFERGLAVVRNTQRHQNEIADKEGRDRQRIDVCPEWLYNNLDTWVRPKHKFLLHWQ
ncbi:hypothetical protein EAF04_002559 [Stromatinia cepivora]|nr:hypothetical protein EAF04_002559 [Stromatinia cepivora]